MKIGSAIHASKESTSGSSTSKTSGASSPSKSDHNSDSLEFSQIPKKYRRRPLTQDEIDLVAVSIFFSFIFCYFNFSFRLVDLLKHDSL